MSLHFISDLHLDETRPQTCRAFFDYLDNLPEEAEALYILGDFFEVWIGDDDDLPFHLEILAKLKEKTKSGLPIYIMHGNRDFLMGKAFAMHTDCILIPDPHIIEYQSQQYLLMHGDTLCTDDVEYIEFREKIRSPDMIASLLAKSLDERREFAQQMRKNSKAANSQKAMTEMDVNQDAVLEAMNTFNINTLIHGHTHRPDIHIIGDKKRIVLGDWGPSGWEIVINENGPQLKSFKLH